jgi:hypothetical protein
MKLAAMPERLSLRPRDHRGYPIPWNVLTADDGSPFFTVNDDRRAWEAVRLLLCPLCGERLGRWRWFVGGPRSAFDPDGWYLDLPGHHDCMRFALQTCPYLSAPKYSGRIDVVDVEKLPPQARILIDETVLPDRPDLFVMVAGDKIEYQARGVLIPYTRPSRPYCGLEYWRTGQQVTESEALPALRAVFGQEWNPPKVEK